MKRELREFVTAFSGINASKLEKQAMLDTREFNVLTGQSINQYGIVDSESCLRAWSYPSKIEKFLLHDKDIVVQMRGNVFKAGLFRCNNASKLQTIATSNFAIIRIKKDVVMLEPEILVSFLNSNFFKETVISTTRSNTMLISIKRLLEESLLIPSLDEQEKLVNLFYNFAELQEKTAEMLNQQAIVAESRLLNVLYK